MISKNTSWASFTGLLSFVNFLYLKYFSDVRSSINVLNECIRKGFNLSLGNYDRFTNIVLVMHIECVQCSRFERNGMTSITKVWWSKVKKEST